MTKVCACDNAPIAGQKKPHYGVKNTDWNYP